MLTNRSHSPLYLPLLIAVCGILFSVWNALDAASVPWCFGRMHALSELFHQRLFPVVGRCGDLLPSGAAGPYRRAGLGRWLAGLAVLLDCVLLGIMILTLPCVACMVAALLLALSYITFRAATLADTHRSALHHASPLLVLWGALFLLTLGGLARSEVGPWAIQAPEMEDETTARVFFSPSCSACRQLVMGMSEADARKIIWCPVAEEEKDLAIILNLKKRIEMGTPLTRSFLPSLETEPMTFWDLFSLEVLTTQFRLWCNDARVISSSEGRLPLVEFMGIPSALVKAKSPASPAARPTAPSAPSEPMFGGQSVLPGQTRAAGSRPPLRYGELRQLWRPQRRTLPLMPEGTFQESYLSPRIEKRLFPLKSQTETVPRPVCTGCGTPFPVWLGDSIPRLERNDL